MQRFWARAKLPAWDALEVQFRKGPPPFLRPGWTSPLLGKRVDLRWLDVGPFDNIKGSVDGWRDAKLLIIEFWASYVQVLPLVLGAQRGVCRRGEGGSSETCHAWRPQATGCRSFAGAGGGEAQKAPAALASGCSPCRRVRTSECAHTDPEIFLRPVQMVQGACNMGHTRLNCLRTDPRAVPSHAWRSSATSRSSRARAPTSRSSPSTRRASSRTRPSTSRPCAGSSRAVTTWTTRYTSIRIGSRSIVRVLSHRVPCSWPAARPPSPCPLRLARRALTKRLRYHSDLSARPESLYPLGCVARFRELNETLSRGFWGPAGLISRAACSLAFIITPKDGVVQWVGNPEEMAAPLERALGTA